MAPWKRTAGKIALIKYREWTGSGLIDIAKGALGIDKKDFSLPLQHRLARVLGAQQWDVDRRRWRPGENPTVRWAACAVPRDARAPSDEN